MESRFENTKWLLQHLLSDVMQNERRLITVQGILRQPFNNIKNRAWARLPWTDNRDISSRSASQKLKSSMPMWHWRKHYLCLKQKKNCWRTFYAGENMVYVILPRSLTHRLFYCCHESYSCPRAVIRRFQRNMKKNISTTWQSVLFTTALLQISPSPFRICTACGIVPDSFPWMYPNILEGNERALSCCFFI